MSTLATTRFRLRVGERVIPLAMPGSVVIGRGAECEVCLDDRAASRRHAAILIDVEGAATVEDLGSVNGIQVNGIVVRGRVPLSHGDRVLVASSTLVFLAHGTPAAATRPRPTAVVRDAGPPDADVLALEAAIAVKERARAEAAAVAAVTRATRAGIDRELLVRLERGLVELGSRDVFWLEQAVELRAADRSVPCADVVSGLQALARSGRPIREGVLRGYLAAMAPQVPALSTADRFAYRRLESLLRVGPHG